MVRYILMDADDTLFDFLKCEAIAVAKTMKAMGIEPTEEKVRRYSAINDLHWKRMERGEITRAQILTGRFRMFLEDYGYDGDLCQKMQDVYVGNLAEELYFLPGAEELIEKLHADGRYELFIVSNGTLFVQRRRIEKSGIARKFRRIFVSGAIGVSKPTVEFFDYVEAHISGFDRSQAVIFGDSLTSDVRGGKNAGIRTVWFNRTHAPIPETDPPDYTVENLADFYPLLEKL